MLKVTVSTEHYIALKDMLNNASLRPTTTSIVSDIIRVTETRNRRSITPDSNAVHFSAQIMCNISPDQLAFLRAKETAEEFSYNSDTADFLEQFTKFSPRAPKGDRVAVSVSMAHFNSLSRMLAEAALCATTKSVLFDIVYLTKNKIKEDERQESGSKHIYYTIPCYISPEQIVYLRSAEAAKEFSFDENTTDFLEQFTDFTPRVI